MTALLTEAIDMNRPELSRQACGPEMLLWCWSVQFQAGFHCCGVSMIAITRLYLVGAFLDYLFLLLLPQHSLGLQGNIDAPFRVSSSTVIYGHDTVICFVYFSSPLYDESFTRRDFALFITLYITFCLISWVNSKFLLNRDASLCQGC